MSQTSCGRRGFLKALVLTPALPVWTNFVIADGSDGKENATTGKPRSILLSKTGGDRATAYAMSNKIARHNGRLLCTWIDSSRQNRWALVDPADGNILYQGARRRPAI